MELSRDEREILEQAVADGRTTSYSPHTGEHNRLADLGLLVMTSPPDMFLDVHFVPTDAAKRLIAATAAPIGEW